MSSSASRKSSADVLTHPEIVALVDAGRRTGEVTAVAVRTATEAAGTSPKDLQAVLRHLSAQGVTVLVPAEETPARKRVAAAASSTRTTVKASAAKSPAKKGASKSAAKGTAKKVAKNAGTAEDAAGASGDAVGGAPLVVGPDGKKVLPDLPDEQFEKDLVADPTLKEEEDESKSFVVSSSDESDEPVQQVMVAGATADPVKDYLKQIGKVPLLNAEMEVELAKRIEAGLF